LATGSELLLGASIDTNSAWLSEFLASMGVEVRAHESRGDDLESLADLIGLSWAKYEVILMTGGLGPTEDDLTRLAVARALGRPLSFSPELAVEIKSLFERRGYSVTSNQLRQAWLPEGAAKIENSLGTAPAFAIESEDKLMVLMPGVPQEMKALTRRFVKDKLREKFPSRLGVVRTTMLMVANLGEGLVDSRLGDLLAGSRNPKLGLLAGQNVTRVVVTTKGRTEAECESLEAPVAREIEKRFGAHFVGRLEPAAAASKLVMEGGLRLGFVDAATNGLMAAPFLKSLPKKSLAGSMVVEARAIDKALDFLFGEMGANMAVVARTDPASWPLEAEELIVSAKIDIVEINPSGRRSSTRHEGRAAGPAQLALARVANMAAFHLWRSLSDLKS
jgi:nicotinamide-nucleotide amidase